MRCNGRSLCWFFFFQAEDGIRDRDVTGFRRVLFRSHDVGTVDVRVTTAGGTSDTAATDGFTYLPLPSQVQVNGNLTGLAGAQRSMVDNIVYTFTQDRKSTRLNSSHITISYAVFCLKK